MTLPFRRVATNPLVRDERPTAMFVVTNDDGSEVVVRFTPGTGHRWRCGCPAGRSQSVSCLHTFSVAIHLAETELGLTRIPELELAHV